MIVRLTKDDVKLVNCADCGRHLLGESVALVPQEQRSLSFHRTVAAYQTVGGRILGRPYCGDCLRLDHGPKRETNCHGRLPRLRNRDMTPEPQPQEAP